MKFHKVIVSEIIRFDYAENLTVSGNPGFCHSRYVYPFLMDVFRKHIAGDSIEYQNPRLRRVPGNYTLNGTHTHCILAVQLKWN